MRFRGKGMLLEKAVRHLKDLPPQESVDVSIDLPLGAYFPRDYVLEMRTKIDLYRRLTRILTEEDLDDFHEELADRFGSPPAPVEQLVELARLRIWAHAWGITSIHQEDKYAVLGYSDPRRMSELVRRSDQRLRVADSRSAYLPLGKQVREVHEILDQLKSLLQPEPIGH